MPCDTGVICTTNYYLLKCDVCHKDFGPYKFKSAAAS